MVAATSSAVAMGRTSLSPVVRVIPSSQPAQPCGAHGRSAHPHTHASSGTLIICPTDFGWAPWAGPMDAADGLAGLLAAPRAQGAFLLRSVLAPPFAVAVRDEAPLTVVSMVRGTAWIVPGAAEPAVLGP